MEEQDGNCANASSMLTSYNTFKYILLDINLLGNALRIKGAGRAK